jgi:cytochrome P450
MGADMGLSVPPLHDPAFHAGDPFPAFRRLRAGGGVHWCESPGFWAVSTHRAVTAVSRDPATFCSSRGVLLSDLQRPIMPRQSIIYIDPPEHTKYRKLVQPAFSPGRIKSLEARIREVTRTLLDVIEAGRPVEFVETFAARLPLLIIADMLGVPGSDRETFKRWSDLIIDAGTEPTPENMQAGVELFGYFSAVLAERRAHPTDDLLSTLARSEVDGERLEEFDLLAFCMTLLVAGNETTRNLLSHGTLALATHPEQLDLLRREPARIPAAVEEMLRWGTPVGSFMRTATRDVELHGTPIREGDRLLLFYSSANRDEAVFGPDADEFRVQRGTGEHVAFGYGEHFCLGAALARMEARIAFEEILARYPGITLAGDVERLRSVFIRGIVRLPVCLAG